MPADASGSSSIIIKMMMAGSIESGTVRGGDSGGPVYYKGSDDGLKLVGFVSSSNSEICVFTPVNTVTGCGVNYAD